MCWCVNRIGKDETITALSGPRLASYRAFFSPVDDLELYGLYCWNEAAASCLTALVSNFEVTMRNAFHRELSRRYGVATGAVSSDWYAVLPLTGRSLENVRDITHQYTSRGRVPRNPQPSPDDIVSNLTFGGFKFRSEHPRLTE